MQTNRTLEIIGAPVCAVRLSQHPLRVVAAVAMASYRMPSNRPERWTVDAGDADIATLDVPPALTRERRFLVDVRFVVACPAPSADAWHALTVELDGRRAWSRQIPTSNPGQADSLDYQCEIELPVGSGLRVRALTRVGRAVRRQLRIDAEEQCD
jgi:hypothetical protein